MARFVQDKKFYPTVANMIIPEINEIAREVEREAKRMAPGTKEWNSRRDNRVRSEHITADAKYGSPEKSIPENLRFEVPSMQWDMQEHGVGPYTYMLRPRDPSFLRYSTTFNCRCFLLPDPLGVARYIEAKPAKNTGTAVVAKIVAERDYILQAEMGATYPGGYVAQGKFFMHGAALRVSALRRNT